MERYETEEQQVEAIKSFFKENGIAIGVGIVLGLGGLGAWQWYGNKVITDKETASIAFQESIEKLNAEDGLAAVESFAKESGNNGYSVLASLMAAQKAVEAKNFESAKSHLNMAVENSPSVAISDLAKIRLARVEHALGDSSAALSTLDSVASEAYAGQVNEVKGDIYVATQDFDKAKQAYDSVLSSQPTNRLVEMKLSNLNFAAIQSSGDASEE
ncbi:tetratricopeptide repeat protein [Glaciecola sp. MH2013]|uniref:YfgM family protein n=1 Tax=Glaciecola sp. MH2013 TaxID=2785524 RepID=UPI0018A0402D|nr:tetratricopeptide repeat protein [Glaciecola sp. MH2013]MBF7074785.1 tetratricopeptide repeat protein [Glaciecola sp. MH2013]